MIVKTAVECLFFTGRVWVQVELPFFSGMLWRRIPNWLRVGLDTLWMSLRALKFSYHSKILWFGVSQEIHTQQLETIPPEGSVFTFDPFAHRNQTWFPLELPRDSQVYNHEKGDVGPCKDGEGSTNGIWLSPSSSVSPMISVCQWIGERSGC